MLGLFRSSRHLSCPPGRWSSRSQCLEEKHCWVSQWGSVGGAGPDWGRDIWADSSDQYCPGFRYLHRGTSLLRNLWHCPPLLVQPSWTTVFRWKFTKTNFSVYLSPLLLKMHNCLTLGGLLKHWLLHNWAGHIVTESDRVKGCHRYVIVIHVG